MLSIWYSMSAVYFLFFIIISACYVLLVLQVQFAKFSFYYL
jgi:hypothetical protein